MSSTISEFCKLKLEIRDFLNQTSNYIEVSELQIKDMVKQSHYTVYHEGDSYDFYGMENESYWFPITLRNSVFVTLYGFLEHILIKMCKTLEVIKRISLSVESFIEDKNNYGSKVVKASNYILSVANIYFPHRLSEWTHIKNCGVLRNSIVHNFAKKNDRVKSLLPMSGITTEIKDITNEVLDFDYMGKAYGVSQLNFDNSFFLLSSFSKEFLNSFATLMNNFFR
ncbi:hypothetical protein [Paenibacillus macquariensis]|uniref:Cthe-2314-like HEPN domain-containing protein n=1 Tax=Paenibacillus macquariensis TaxID=948756 RepID=A0ABY1KEW9_9BACL|nr:hypothetical protein [Paenibacillus macquariensis]OAB29593.1 hypothetical protein PMSM_23705 [Paenibacillus macquariensis subsp. macquariensis]SIR73049.1 hypothetical protein SAMN05421578_1501 [Paenibacillus macquariensis]